MTGPQCPWDVLWRFRTPVDPDYGGPTSTVTLWHDNLGGLVLGMDCGDGQTVIVLPIPGDDLDDLCAAILTCRTTPRPAANAGLSPLEKPSPDFRSNAQEGTR